MKRFVEYLISIAVMTALASFYTAVLTVAFGLTHRQFVWMMLISGIVTGICLKKQLMRFMSL